MAQSFAQLERKIELVAKELDGRGMRERLERVGAQSHGDIDVAVRGTLGDQSMSGWKRGNPIEIKGAHRMVGDTALFLSAGKASGPMRVLQSGRNQGGGGFAGPGISRDGTTRRTKSGAVAKTRARKAKRWNGTTQGKGTWDVAEATLAAKAPARVAREVHKAIGKFISGG